MTEHGRTNVKTYQWVIGVLVGLLLFLGGWVAKPSPTAQINDLRQCFSNKDAELERRIAVLENIAMTNRDNITYIRNQVDILVKNQK